jgi:hypothetical protein
MNLISAYRRATRGGLRIGFEYSKGIIWNCELHAYAPVNVRIDVTISAGDRRYYYDNQELDTGRISRRTFWRQLKKYVKHGYAEINNRRPQRRE